MVPFRSLLDHSSDAFLAHDFLGRRVYANEVYDRLVGRPASSMVGWGPFPDWAGGTANLVSVGMRRARDPAPAGASPPEALVAKLSHPSGQYVEVTMQFDVVGRGDAAIGLALVRPLHRVPWMERRSGADISQLQALEDVVRSIAMELSRVGVSPVIDAEVPDGASRITELTALSPSEWRILQEILLGRRVPGIAAYLHLSQHTVRNHLKAIFRKLGVHSQSELVERYRAIRGRGDAAQTR
jgi:DNA-binding CsgD family transcriptional regulator